MNYAKYILLFLITFLVAGVNAQDSSATADSGKRIALHADGTWEYASETAGLENNQHGDNIVYVTCTGEKYHRSDCRHLRKSKIPTSLQIATEVYSACSTCKPPGWK